MIDVKSLSAGYGSRDVIKDITTTGSQGEFIALIGPNGSGKSTLIKSIAGLVNPSAGIAELNNYNIHAMPLKARARQIAYLAQSREAAPAMLVEDLVRLGRAPYRGALGTISDGGEAAISSAMNRTQSTRLKDRRFDSLSGGEQARILLSRALAVGAPALLVDEPIAALDPYYQLTMMQMLREQANAGTLIIAALHDLALVQQFADRIWVMHEGHLVKDAEPKTALSSNILKTVFGIKAPKGGFQIAELN